MDNTTGSSVLSLQGTIIANYIDLQASWNDLDILLTKCLAAKSAQVDRMKLLVNNYWYEIKCDLHIDFPLTIKRSYDGQYTGSSSTYAAFIIVIDTERNRIKVTIEETLCWTNINADGTVNKCHLVNGMVADGCISFNQLKADKKAIEQLLYLLQVTHPKIVFKTNELRSARLE